MTEEKKGKKCICCAISGVVLIILGLSADYIGIGEGSVFGYKQILTVVIGAVLLLLGLTTCKFGKFCKCGQGKS